MNIKLGLSDLLHLCRRGFIGFRTGTRRNQDIDTKIGIGDLFRDILQRRDTDSNRRLVALRFGAHGYNQATQNYCNKWYSEFHTMM